jgi:hypothetical protein
MNEALERYLNNLGRLFIQAVKSIEPAYVLRPLGGALALAARDLQWLRDGARGLAGLGRIDRDELDRRARQRWQQHRQQLVQRIESAGEANALRAIAAYFRGYDIEEIQTPEQARELVVTQSAMGQGYAISYPAWQRDLANSRAEFLQRLQNLDTLRDPIAGSATTIDVVATSRDIDNISDEEWDRSLARGRAVGNVVDIVGVAGEAHQARDAQRTIGAPIDTGMRRGTSVVTGPQQSEVEPEADPVRAIPPRPRPSRAADRTAPPNPAQTNPPRSSNQRGRPDRRPPPHHDRGTNSAARDVEPHHRSVARAPDIAPYTATGHGAGAPANVPARPRPASPHSVTGATGQTGSDELNADAALQEGAPFQRSRLRGVDRQGRHLEDRGGEELEFASRRQRRNPSPSIPALESLNLQPEQIQIARQIIGQRFDWRWRGTWVMANNDQTRSEMAEVARRWSRETPGARNAARELARKAYENYLGRFWIRVKNDAVLYSMLQRAGFVVPGGDGAPYYAFPDGRRETLTLDHSTRVMDDPRRAVWGGNFVFSLRRENTGSLEGIRNRDLEQRR